MAVVIEQTTIEQTQKVSKQTIVLANLPVQISEKVIFIKHTSLKDGNMTAQDLYEKTRHDWKLKPTRAAKAELVFAIYNCKVVEVYIPERWFEEINTKRLTFEGKVAPFHIRDKYIGLHLPNFATVRYPASYSY